MKSIILSILIFPLMSLAGGSRVGCSVGGDVVSVDVATSSIVYYQGEKNGVVTFTHGSFENGQWKIQNFEVPANEMTADSALTKAVEASKEARDWVEIR